MKKKEKVIIVALILIMIISIIGVSYAAFNYSKTGTKVNSITTGSITMGYTESDNVINIDKALPTTDETGKVRLKEGEYFDFTISSEIVGDININYEISAKDVTVGNRKIDGSNKEVYQNKSNSYITGCSYGSPSNGNTDYGCQYTYDEEINGTGASTTGTIYGIYDMSGGSWEYVMSNYNNVGDGSGFTSMPESKYYDKYTSNDVLTACDGNECLSHSLNETIGWYNDRFNMASETYPWLLLGGNYGQSVDTFGIFSTTSNGGNVVDFNSFRLVITSTT